MSEFNPGVSGINHLDFDPLCAIDGCARGAVYFHRWAMMCGCREDSLFCAGHSAIVKVRYDQDTSTRWVCRTPSCLRITYGRANVLLKVSLIPARKP